MSQRWTPLIVALAAASALTGARYPTELDRPDAREAAPSFAFSDRRPPVQSESGYESKFIAKCSFYAIRIGGQDISPEPATVVLTALAERYGERLAGRTVELTDFAVHLNASAPYRAWQGRMITGLIPEKLNDEKKTGCADHDTIGSYRASEVGPRQAPIIVVINLRIDGRPFHARAIAAYEIGDQPSGVVVPPRKNADPGERALWNRSVSAVVAKALAQLGESIDAGLFGAAAGPATAVPAPAPAPASAVPAPTPVE